MAGPNEKIVRRVMEVLNSCKSVDEAIATGVEELWDPEIEWINPEDALERGTRKGVAGMRTVLENIFAGAGAGAIVEIEELQEGEDRVFARTRVHARGAASGAQAVGPSTGAVFTFRDDRILRIEWHYDVDRARASFEQDG